MDLVLPYKKQKTADKAYTKVQSTFTPESLQEFKITGTIKANDAKKILTAKGSNFTLTLSFLEDELQGELELGLLLRPLKSTILATIEKKLKAIL